MMTLNNLCYYKVKYRKSSKQMKNKNKHTWTVVLCAVPYSPNTRAIRKLSKLDTDFNKHTIIHALFKNDIMHAQYG